MTTVSIYYNIKDLFNQDKLKSIKDEFSCSTCSELIYKQEWYQCNQGHVGCSKCWDKIINGSNKCSSCKTPIKSFTDGLSRCRFIEQLFTYKKIRCPYNYNENIMNNIQNNKLVHDLDNGCKDIIKVEQLEDHQKNCNSRFVKCSNEGCNQLSRYIQHLEHENECQHTVIECQLCNNGVKRPSLTNHKELCPSRIITCTQCPAELKKSELQNHINNQCPNTIIECKFQPYGCKDEFKRSELSNHLEQVNHTTYMLQLIKDQEEQLDKKSQQLDNQSKQLDEYKKELQESNKRCNNILNKIMMNNGTSYSNIWIISNFLQRTGADKDPIYSPIVNVPPYQFKLSIVYLNNIPNYYLYLIDSKTKRNDGTTKFKFTIKLLNHKYLTHNLMLTLENSYEINGQGWGKGFNNVLYSIESGYIFPDGSVHLDFKIDIPKPTIQS